MPVYKKSGLVHIHIPKTAGTAIGGLFHSHNDMVWGTESWIGQKYIDQRWFEFQHFSLAEFIRFTGDEFSGFVSFAVLRNPYTRLISEFHWRQNRSSGQSNPNMLYFDSFDQMLSAIPEDIDNNWDYHMAFSEKSYANFLIHVRPQHHYVYGPDGAPGLDHLLVYERLKSELQNLLKGLNLDTGRIRNPATRPYVDYYDRRTLDLVNEIYRKDFELGSYEII